MDGNLVAAVCRVGRRCADAALMLSCCVMLFLALFYPGLALAMPLLMAACFACQHPGKNRKNGEYLPFYPFMSL